MAAILAIHAGSHELRLTALIVALVLASFSPSNVLLMLHSLNPRTYVRSLVLSTLNSCIYTFICYYMSQDSRDKIQTMLCGQPKART